MAKIPDDLSLQDLCNQAAQALSRAGLNHRIDIYRDIEVDDPAVRMMLGRSHKVRVRLKITATSLLFDNSEQSTTEQPTTEQPTTEQPTTEQPTTEQPATAQPTRAKSIDEEAMQSLNGA